MKSPRDWSTWGYRKIVWTLVALVIVPTSLQLAIGALLLVFGEAKLNLVMGGLVLVLGGAAGTGIVLVWVFLRREANLSQLQSDFVSKVSHELRTPLTSIRLFAETLALRRADPSTTDKCIAGLEREASRLQDLIDRLLDWGRMESGMREFELRETEVSSIVDAALVAVAPLVEQFQVETSVSIAPNVTKLWGDRGALVDALVNLLTNASKYGGTPPRIRIGVTEDANHLRISVEDNGSGIPAAEHKRIFQKFYRVDDRLARVQQGSGLGLAIVKHVVRAHGGRVELKSSPGQGSVFTLVLPRNGDGA
jgi:two-component system, OmpR family, phosphate regulon sensor histidine kinase PhoR